MLNGSEDIKSQLEQGTEVDVVILSGEGLDELKAAGRIAAGSDVKLAGVPLGAAIRQGSPKPDISTVDALKRALLGARLVALPGSTSGIFMKNEVFPRLGIADKVTSKLFARGIELTNALAAGEADLAIGPISEQVNQPGIEVVGPLPDEVQLVQMFTAAIVSTAQHSGAGQAVDRVPGIRPNHGGNQEFRHGNRRATAANTSMIRKSVKRFSEKIMLHQKTKAR